MKQPCAFPTCERDARTGGLCAPHDGQRRRGTELHPLRVAKQSETPCAVEACDKRAESKGWCPSHYARWRRYGDPGTTPIAEVTAPARCEGPGRDGGTCGQPVKAKKLCGSHYSQLFKTGELKPLGIWGNQRPRKMCTGPECDRYAKSNGLCGTHMVQARRHGVDNLLPIGTHRRKPTEPKPPRERKAPKPPRERKAPKPRERYRSSLPKPKPVSTLPAGWFKPTIEKPKPARRKPIDQLAEDAAVLYMGEINKPTAEQEAAALATLRAWGHADLAEMVLGRAA